jgi:cobalt transporter subunit CbtA
MLSSALFAGFAVGLLAALLHFAFVEQKILLAEEYEGGALVHFQGVAAGAEDHHADAAAPGDAAVAEDGHDHDHAAEEEENAPLVRHGLSVLFAALIYVGYALVMVSGFAIALRFGITVTPVTGLLWGLAAFLAFQMAPAMGLEPELPGTPAADLTARQLWWGGCAIATAGGLALIGYGKGVLPRVAGVLLLALPHVIGAPEPEHFGGIVPPELSSSFAARSLGVGLIAWVSLGWLLAWFWNREPV